MAQHTLHFLELKGNCFSFTPAMAIAVSSQRMRWCLAFFFWRKQSSNIFMSDHGCVTSSVCISRRDFISSQTELAQPLYFKSYICAPMYVTVHCDSEYSPSAVCKREARPVFNLPTRKNKKRLRVNGEALPSSSVLSLPFILFSLGVSMWNKLLTAALPCLRVLARRLSGTPHFAAWYVVLSSVRLAWCPTARQVQLPFYSLSFWQHIFFSSLYSPSPSRFPLIFPLFTPHLVPPPMSLFNSDLPPLFCLITQRWWSSSWEPRAMSFYDSNCFPLCHWLQLSENGSATEGCNVAHWPPTICRLSQQTHSKVEAEVVV